MSKPALENELSKIDEMSEARSIRVVDDEDPKAVTPVRIDRVIWGVWWIGTILIVLSWVDVVSNTIGWIGFAAALASTVVSVLIKKYWRVPK